LPDLGEIPPHLKFHASSISPAHLSPAHLICLATGLLLLLAKRRRFWEYRSIVWLEEVWSWLDRRAPKPKGAEGSSTCLRWRGLIDENRQCMAYEHRPFRQRGRALKSSINPGPLYLIGSCPGNPQ
jgi:hypothetical protein